MAMMTSRKPQLKWRSFSATVRLTLAEALEKEVDIGQPSCPLADASRRAQRAGARDRAAGIPPMMSWAIGPATLAPADAMLDHDGDGIARLLDRGEGDEERVIAHRPGQIVVLAHAHHALRHGDAADLGAAGLAGHLHAGLADPRAIGGAVRIVHHHAHPVATPASDAPASAPCSGNMTLAGSGPVGLGELGRRAPAAGFRA